MKRQWLAVNKWYNELGAAGEFGVYMISAFVLIVLFNTLGMESYWDVLTFVVLWFGNEYAYYRYNGDDK